jgi:hypothetical protein
MPTTTARRIPTDALTVAPIAMAASGDIVAAVSAKKILVWDILITNADVAKTLILKSGTTALTGAMSFTQLHLSRLPNAVSGFSSGVPLFETASGEALVGTQSASGVMAGQIIYSTE